MEKSMKDLNQLLLKFDLKQNYKNEDFYVNKSNFFAFNLIDKWPKWEKNILNIYGEKYCGKTHLSNIFKKKYKAFKIRANEFNSNNLKEFLEERKPGVGCEICIPSLAKLIRDYNYSEQFCENE